MRNAPSTRYVQGPDGVLYPGDAAPSTSDPEIPAGLCLAAVSRCADKSVLSNEIFDASRSLALMEHLSPLRANLLRPLENMLRGKRVLEFGAGCGGLTRYLGETAAHVTAVESDPAMARAAAARCSDLPSVAVVCDSLTNLAVPEPVDVVLAVGVAELARREAIQECPELDLFRAAKEHLNPRGRLIVAADNRMGLRYLAGTPEPHTGKPYHGLHGLCGNAESGTLGRAELERLLAKAGFVSLAQFAPLPGYRLPVTVLHPAALEPDPPMDLTPLILNSFPYDRTRPGRLSFSLELAWKSAVSNNLVRDLCDALLFVASTDSAPSPWDASVLVSHYGGARFRNFAKETIFRIGDNGVRVSRRFLAPDAERSFRGLEVSAVPEESYLRLETLQDTLLPVINTPGWKAGDIAAWAAPWIGFLRALADGGTMLPSNAVDMIPANMFVGRDGSLVPFDDEWRYADGQFLPLAFVAVRGLFFALSGVYTVAPPAEGTPTVITELVARVLARHGVKVPPREMEECIARMGEFARSAVGGFSRVKTVMERSLLVRPLA